MTVKRQMKTKQSAKQSASKRQYATAAVIDGMRWQQAAICNGSSNRRYAVAANGSMRRQQETSQQEFRRSNRTLQFCLQPQAETACRLRARGRPFGSWAFGANEAKYSKEPTYNRECPRKRKQCGFHSLQCIKKGTPQRPFRLFRGMPFAPPGPAPEGAAPRNKPHASSAAAAP